MLAPRLSEQLGRQFFVENKPGAGGTIGADFVAKSPPDGYTLLLTGTPHVISAHLYKKLPYDALKDFTHIALIASGPYALVVNPQKVPARLGARADRRWPRRKPGKIDYASSGNGSAQHLVGALFNSMAGIELNHVPYKGSGPAMQDLIAGQVGVSFAGMPNVLGHVKAGRLKALGVTTAKRWSELPDVPTLAEAGVPGYEATLWLNISGPADMPAEIVQRLNARDRQGAARPRAAGELPRRRRRRHVDGPAGAASASCAPSTRSGAAWCAKPARPSIKFLPARLPRGAGRGSRAGPARSTRPSPACRRFAELEAAGARIGEIRVVPGNIFDLNDPRENNFFFRLANKLHIHTRPEVIRQALLFESGQPVSVQKIEETERLLRGYDFLYDVDIRPVAVHDGVVDVEVRTRDTWSLDVSASASREGGANKGRMSVEEENLLGTGISVGVVLYVRRRPQAAPRSTSPTATSSARAAVASYAYADNDDGNGQSLLAAAPFLRARRALGRRLRRLGERRHRRAVQRRQQRRRVPPSQPAGGGFGGWSAGPGRRLDAALFGRRAAPGTTTTSSSRARRRPSACPRTSGWPARSCASS